ncbi:MAG: ATP-binding protein [Thermoplasmata archaeon]|jgi:predicted ATPase|nr:ATP-binding protein [Thermoplasmata archaeon]
MRLELHNIGCIGDADIRLDGITVLTGYNSTGKSTVLKAAYALLSSQHDVRKRVTDDIEDRVYMVQHVYSRSPESKESSSTLLQRLSEVLSMKEPERKLPASYLKELSLMKDYLEGKTETSVFSRQYLLDCLEEEFDGQMFTIGSEGGFARMTLDDGAVISVNDKMEAAVMNDTETPSVSYFDTPLVLDQGSPYILPHKMADWDHRSDIAEKLFRSNNATSVFDRIASEESVSKLDSVISRALPGTLRFTNKGLVYDSEEAKGVKASNLASGMKVFAIIRILVKKGHLMEGDVLLIDEPEIHLHPEWQHVLAELLVSMSKELGVRILMTTHSPQFLMSIEGYSSQEDVGARFYQAVDSGKRTFRDVTDDLEAVYRSMTQPLIEADDMRHGDE